MLRTSRRRGGGWQVGLVLSAVLVAGCSGQQQSETVVVPEPAGGPDGGAPPEVPTDVGQAAVTDDEPLVEIPDGDPEAVCRAYAASDEADPVHRWIRAFPLRRGGVVLVFTGPRAEQTGIELVLEMAGVMGYDDHTCGTAVVVWIPGIECGSDTTALAERIESDTVMTLFERQCFLIDETRLRIRMQCSQGSLPTEHCP